MPAVTGWLPAPLADRPHHHHRHHLLCRHRGDRRHLWHEPCQQLGWAAGHNMDQVCPGVCLPTLTAPLNTSAGASACHAQSPSVPRLGRAYPAVESPPNVRMAVQQRAGVAGHTARDVGGGGKFLVLCASAQRPASCFCGSWALQLDLWAQRMCSAADH